MKTLKIKILIGIPASGKTTWSKDFVRSNDNWTRVSRDDFREMLKNSGVVENKVENIINELVNSTIEQSLLKKECVIASPVSGSGMIINQDTALFLLATGMHGIHNAAEWICEWMELQGYENSLHLELQVKAQYSIFMETLPFWIKMGIL